MTCSPLVAPDEAGATNYRSPAFNQASELLIVSAHDADRIYFFKKEHGTTVLFCERVANLARHCGRVRRGDVRHRGHDDPPFADRHHGHDLDARNSLSKMTLTPSNSPS